MADTGGGSALWEGGIGGGGGGEGDGVWPSSKTKIRGLHGSSPPPFLIKTYEMVDDPLTNHIISWSHSGNSFIVWNHLILASDILPRFFRHSNFSSFIYQLNNYGFRKIGLQRWEYENAWFQAGKKHLLMNIKSRHHKLRKMSQRGSQECVYEMKEELDSLRDDQNMITAEMHKLKQMQEDMQSQMCAFKKHVRMVETKSREELTVLAKAMNKVMMKEVLKYVREGKEQKLGLQGTGEMSKSGEGKDESIEVDTSESSKSFGAETGKNKAEEEQQKKEVKLDDLMISKMIMDEAEDVIAKTTSLEEEEVVVVVNLEL
ncbi:PREDICTED: heat stress transcription factor A-7a-like [Ipomoea nil]|uniref:heat stress transcription factor A-7a-like n=1 Tax=Ipomoea nil TaxID=35883 RepID=UPI0009009CAD|nr:PREDICTED: heat stress transcription factor A-7a-like [Ipomoea nil]